MKLPQSILDDLIKKAGDDAGDAILRVVPLVSDQSQRVIIVFGAVFSMLQLATATLAIVKGANRELSKEEKLKNFLAISEVLQMRAEVLWGDASKFSIKDQLEALMK